VEVIADLFSAREAGQQAPTAKAKTTLQSYAKPDGVALGRTKKVTARLLGGSLRAGIRRNIVPVPFPQKKNAALRRRIP